MKCRLEFGAYLSRIEIKGKLGCLGTSCKLGHVSLSQWVFYELVILFQFRSPKKNEFCYIAHRNFQGKNERWHTLISCKGEKLVLKMCFELTPVFEGSKNYLK